MSVARLFYFKAFLPTTSSTYEDFSYYPEALYEEYEKAAEKMIEEENFSCEYPAKSTFYSTDNQLTLVVEVGDCYKEYEFSNYVTATVKNFGTSSQEVTFERSRGSAEEVHEKAESLKNKNDIIIQVLLILWLLSTAYLIRAYIKKQYHILIGTGVSICFIILGIVFFPLFFPQV